jgi:hypothetical protein
MHEADVLSDDERASEVSISRQREEVKRIVLLPGSAV